MTSTSYKTDIFIATKLLLPNDFCCVRSESYQDTLCTESFDKTSGNLSRPSYWVGRIVKPLEHNLYRLNWYAEMPNEPGLFVRTDHYFTEDRQAIVPLKEGLTPCEMRDVYQTTTNIHEFLQDSSSSIGKGPVESEFKATIAELELLEPRVGKVKNESTNEVSENAESEVNRVNIVTPGEMGTFRNGNDSTAVHLDCVVQPCEDSNSSHSSSMSSNTNLSEKTIETTLITSVLEKPVDPEIQSKDEPPNLDSSVSCDLAILQNLNSTDAKGNLSEIETDTDDQVCDNFLTSVEHKRKFSAVSDVESVADNSVKDEQASNATHATGFGMTVKKQKALQTQNDEETRRKMSTRIALKPISSLQQKLDYDDIELVPKYFNKVEPRVGVDYQCAVLPFVERSKKEFAEETQGEIKSHIVYPIGEAPPLAKYLCILPKSSDCWYNCETEKGVNIGGNGINKTSDSKSNLNPEWSQAEKTAFEKGLYEHSANFHKVARFISKSVRKGKRPTKSTNMCVQYFYDHFRESRAFKIWYKHEIAKFEKIERQRLEEEKQKLKDEKKLRRRHLKLGVEEGYSNKLLESRKVVKALLKIQRIVKMFPKIDHLKKEESNQEFEEDDIDTKHEVVTNTFFPGFNTAALTMAQIEHLRQLESLQQLSQSNPMPQLNLHSVHSMDQPTDKMQDLAGEERKLFSKEAKKEKQIKNIYEMLNQTKKASTNKASIDTSGSSLSIQRNDFEYPFSLPLNPSELQLNAILLRLQQLQQQSLHAPGEADSTLDSSKQVNMENNLAFLRSLQDQITSLSHQIHRNPPTTNSVQETLLPKLSNITEGSKKVQPNEPNQILSTNINHSSLEGNKEGSNRTDASAIEKSVSNISHLESATEKMIANTANKGPGLLGEQQIFLPQLQQSKVMQLANPEQKVHGNIPPVRNNGNAAAAAATAILNNSSNLSPQQMEALKLQVRMQAQQNDLWTGFSHLKLIGQIPQNTTFEQYLSYLGQGDRRHFNQSQVSSQSFQQSQAAEDQSSKTQADKKILNNNHHSFSALEISQGHSSYPNAASIMAINELEMQKKLYDTTLYQLKQNYHMTKMKLNIIQQQESAQLQFMQAQQQQSFSQTVPQDHTERLKLMKNQESERNLLVMQHKHRIEQFESETNQQLQELQKQRENLQRSQEEHKRLLGNTHNASLGTDLVNFSNSVLNNNNSSPGIALQTSHQSQKPPSHNFSKTQQVREDSQTRQYRRNDEVASGDHATKTERSLAMHQIPQPPQNINDTATLEQLRQFLTQQNQRNKTPGVKSVVSSQTVNTSMGVENIRTDSHVPQNDNGQRMVNMSAHTAGNLDISSILNNSKLQSPAVHRSLNQSGTQGQQFINLSQEQQSNKAHQPQEMKRSLPNDHNQQYTSNLENQAQQQMFQQQLMKQLQSNQDNNFSHSNGLNFSAMNPLLMQALLLNNQNLGQQLNPIQQLEQHLRCTSSSTSQQTSSAGVLNQSITEEQLKLLKQLSQQPQQDLNLYQQLLRLNPANQNSFRTNQPPSLTGEQLQVLKQLHLQSQQDLNLYNQFAHMIPSGHSGSINLPTSLNFDHAQLLKQLQQQNQNQAVFNQPVQHTNEGNMSNNSLSNLLNTNMIQQLQKLHQQQQQQQQSAQRGTTQTNSVDSDTGGSPSNSSGHAGFEDSATNGSNRKIMNCKIPGCNKSYTQRHNLKTHMRKKHNFD